jgi:hypothetical protein
MSDNPKIPAHEMAKVMPDLMRAGNVMEMVYTDADNKRVTMRASDGYIPHFDDSNVASSDGEAE